MERTSRRGLLFVISAPSGTGKSTVARSLLQRLPDLEFSVSYTTRSRRRGELDGREYHFVERVEFEEMVDRGAFLEWAQVFDQFYGTGLDVTRKALEQGRNLLLDIDVQGARQVRAHGEPCVSVMLLPPDFPTLEARLVSRASESEEDRTRRLARAREEAQDFRFFDYVVVNREIERAVADLESIVRAEQRRVGHCAGEAESILATFPA